MDDQQKDPAAVALGKRRAAGLTSEHQAAAARARAKAMTQRERRAHARMMAAARYAKVAAARSGDGK